MEKLQELIIGFVQAIHDVSARAMILSATILAPIPSAIALYRALHEAYGDWTIVIAITVEVLGYSSIAFLIRTIEEKANRPLLAMGGVFSAIYIVTVLASISILPHDEWARVARAFPLFTLVGAGVYSGNRMLDARKTQPFEEAKQVIDLDDYKQRLRIERTALKQSTTTPTPSAPKQDKRAEAEKYMRDNPDAKEAEFVEATGQSRATYYRIKREQREQT